MARTRRGLLVSIHDVGPRSEAAVERLLDLLSARAPREKIAMLVVPDHWGEAPIVAGSAFATRLRDWAQAGHEMFVHGWFHRDDAHHAGPAARWKAQHMTAGEGEFLGLDDPTAFDRMQAGRALIEDVTGRPVAGFVAPAWLYGPGALTALPKAGFALAEDHWKIWAPAHGNRLVGRAPVVTWASRSRRKIATSLIGTAIVPPLLRAFPLVRLAVHPGDVAVPALLGSIDRCLRRLLRYREVIRYADLSGPAARAVTP